MFALVSNGAVNAVSPSPRTVTSGAWLPLVEDPATYSTYEQQVPDRYTISETMVTRHWRTVPPPPTREEYNALVDELRKRHYDGPVNGTAWTRPRGYIDAYPQGSIVTHDSKTWKATQDGAAGEPGVDDGWIEITTGDEPLPWSQPHAGEEFPPGALVTYDGHTWRNDLGKPNGYQPGQTGSGWTQTD